MYATQQSCPPTIPWCYMALSNATEAADLGARLHQLRVPSGGMLEKIPTFLRGWHSSSSLQPFGFKHPWWYEDSPQYRLTGLPPAEINQEVEVASAYFNLITTIGAVADRH
ncbi:hypothetical protein V8E55_006996 [Tylopilus felleus]